MLFHVSEERGIDRFEPRPSESARGPVVSAVDAGRLRNYLVPRECPRVTYYAGRESTPADVERFLGSGTAVIAIERDWFERLRSCRLFCYHLLPDTFECLDECAGYCEPSTGRPRARGSRRRRGIRVVEAWSGVANRAELLASSRCSRRLKFAVLHYPYAQCATAAGGQIREFGVVEGRG
jgi:hypothetical protein